VTSISDKLAIEGGVPVRTETLPYGRHSVTDDDIESVVRVLRSDWLTTGPLVAEFEGAVAKATGADHAVVVSNGTAALHSATYALAIGPGDEVAVPAMTFAASANCVVYQGGKPVFVDVDPDTLTMDPTSLRDRITPKTKALITVDYAGQPCDYDEILKIARQHNLRVIDDACHAIGGSYKGRPVGTLTNLSTFSFHPVKHVTSGEGGAITTNDETLAQRMRIFRNHGITTDHWQRAKQQSWFYEMVDLGYNYRLSDINCALGLSQLTRLQQGISRRREIANAYDSAFASTPEISPLSVMPDVYHAYHIYVVQVNLDLLDANRDQVAAALRAEGIGINVHYVPVHLHPFYQSQFGTGIGDCPAAEKAYERMITLPIFPDMSEKDTSDVITAVQRVMNRYSK